MQLARLERKQGFSKVNVIKTLSEVHALLRVSHSIRLPCSLPLRAGTLAGVQQRGQS